MWRRALACSSCVAFLAAGLSSCDDNSSPPQRPAAPSGLSAAAGDGRVTLAWQPALHADTYRVYWSTTPGAPGGESFISVDTEAAHTGIVNGRTYYYAVTARNRGGESVPSAEVSATPMSGPGSGDPLRADQWQLHNTGQEGGTPGEDINVVPAWSAGLRGEGIRIAIVDEDLDLNHEDLATNVATARSYNYDDGSDDPACPPIATTCGHGTGVAGVVAGRDLNDLGIAGVAPRANLAGYNLLQERTMSNEADAMLRGAADVHVSINSWGPPDDADLHVAPGIWREAIEAGLRDGRGGAGTVYVWAAGNGALAGDNSNYDGYANHRGVIAVCAVDDAGRHAEYSEPGANLRVCAPSRAAIGSGHGITTTDRAGPVGRNRLGAPDYENTAYSKLFTGTSAAVPAVGGVVALMLQANPSLGWRDVQAILAQSARRNDTAHGDWMQNGAGYWINHLYGFGVVDAGAAVAVAGAWINFAPPRSFSLSAAPALAIPDDDPAGVSHTLTVTDSGISSIEFVAVQFDAAEHTYAGDLEIVLVNETTATPSVLAAPHDCPGLRCAPYTGWRFGSARHLGEAADGDWTLRVTDRAALDSGSFNAWRLTFYGR